MSENKKNYIIIFLVIVIVLETTLFFINNDKKDEKNNDIKDNTNLETNNDKNEDTNNDNIVKELSIDDKKVKELYEFINKFGPTGDFYETGQGSFHKSINVNLSNLTDKEKLELLMFNSYNKIKEDEIKKGSEGQHNSELTQYIYNKDKMFDFGKKLFGPAFKIENKVKYDSNCGGKYIYDGDKFIHLLYPGGCGSARDFAFYTKLVKAEKDNENIYLYDKYLYLRTYYNVGGNTKNNLYTHIYDSYDRMNFITSFNQDNYVIKDLLNGKEVYAKEINLTIEEINNIKELHNKALTYKHTFKKDADGNYYWVSSEKMK